MKDCLEITNSNQYQPRITGLGDIYEVISVKVKTKHYFKRYPGSIMFLSSNRDHGGRGLSLTELKKKVLKDSFSILKDGYVDSPFWKSKPRICSISPLLKIPLVEVLVLPIFYFLILFEFLWEGKNHSHMIFVLGKKNG